MASPVAAPRAELVLRAPGASPRDVVAKPAPPPPGASPPDVAAKLAPPPPSDSPERRRRRRAAIAAASGCCAAVVCAIVVALAVALTQPGAAPRSVTIGVGTGVTLKSMTGSAFLTDEGNVRPALLEALRTRFPETNVTVMRVSTNSSVSGLTVD
jgi:hypothetical protein